MGPSGPGAATAGAGRREAVQLSGQSPAAVAKIDDHFVRRAKVGSLAGVAVRVTYADGTTSNGWYLQAEPLLMSMAGQAALQAYVQTKKGSKIAKYL